MAQVQLSQRGGVTVIRLSGELTHEGVQPVEQAVRSAVEQARGGTVLDLSEVRLITTPGIALLLASLEWARDGGRKLVFTGIAGSIEELLLDRCRLDLVLTISPTVDSAVAAAGA